MDAFLTQILKPEGIFLQQFVTGYDVHETFLLGSPGLPGCLGTGNCAEQLHDLTQTGAAFGIPGTDGLAQLGIADELHEQLHQLLFQFNALPQAGKGIHALQTFRESIVLLYQRPQGIHVRCKGRIVKTLVNSVQIPNIFHIAFLLFCMALFYTRTSAASTRGYAPPPFPFFLLKNKFFDRYL